MFNAWIGYRVSSKPACATYLLERKGRGGARNVLSGRALSYYAEGKGPVPTDELRINQS